jgi:hypothetical protein
MKHNNSDSQLAAALNKPNVSGWVAVSERLPELDKNVLLFDDWKTTDGEQRKDIRIGYLSDFTTRKTSRIKSLLRMERNSVCV